MSDAPPAEIAARKQRRAKFFAYVVLVFIIATVAAWWVVPQFAANAKNVAAAMSAKETPAAVVTLLRLTTFFKVFWVPIGIGCAVLGFLGSRGALDPFLPALNVLLVIVGAGILGLCLYSYYLTLPSLGTVLSP